MRTKPTILVSTPNGRTGRAAVQWLLKHGYPTRALVRREDSRSQALAAQGVEVVIGSLHDWRDLNRAMKGVQRAYHCPPFDATHLHNAMLFALAAEQNELEVVALMSGWNPHAAHPSVVQREHWLTNSLFHWMPTVDVIHINPGMFAFTYLLGLPAAKHFGMLALPFGEGLNAPPSNEDIGQVAAGALMDPKRYVNRCLRPMGPERVSGIDVAGHLAEALGRKVKYRPSTIALFTKFAIAMGFPRFQIAQVRHYAEEMRRGVYGQPPNDTVREVTGQPAEHMRDIVRRYVASPELIMPTMPTGGWWQATGLMLRAALSRVPNLDSWETGRDYPTIANGQLAHESPEWQAASSAGHLMLQGVQPSALGEAA